MADVAEEYRDESLSQIIQNRKNESKRVEEYRTLCEQRGQEPCVLDISAAEQPLSLPEPLERQTALPNLSESSMPESEGYVAPVGGECQSASSAGAG